MLILGGNQLAAGGYDVANSCRFDRDSSDYLTRTPGSAGNTQTWTWSSWVKRSSNLTVEQNIIHCYDGSADNRAQIKFQPDATIGFDTGGTGSLGRIDTSAVYRDVSAWYHIVVVMDTTNATATDRQRIYVNGVRATTTVDVQVGLNFSGGLINTANAQEIGTYGAGSGGHIDGYMSEIVFIDGSALDPTSFGEFDEDTGIWKPIDVSELTFGTNGYYLPFENSAALGQDDSGNGNNFTVNNLTSNNQTTDTPTNNFATLDGVFVSQAASYGTSPLEEGNLINTNDGSNTNYIAQCNVPMSSGTWYIEFKVGADMSGGMNIGIRESDKTHTTHTGTGQATWQQDGKFKIDNVQTATIASYTTNDILGFLYNASSGTLVCYKNGTSQGTVFTAGSGKNWIFFVIRNNVSTNYQDQWNFGNPTFTISSGNSDGNGYGNFEYSTNGGYALNTKNLAEYG